MATIVQVAHGYSTTGTTTATLPNAVTARNQLFVIVTSSVKTAFSVSSVSDTTTDTFDITAFPWSQVNTPNGAKALGVGIYVATSATGSTGANSETFTVVLSSAQAVEIFVAEVNLGFIPTLDGSVSAVTSDSSTFSTSISPSTADFILSVGGITYRGYSLTSWNNGFTGGDFDNSNSTSIGWAYLQQSVAGTANPSMTLSSNANGGIMAVAFKETTAPDITEVSDSILSPVQNAVTTSTTGGSLGAGTYTYYFTAYNATGETELSNAQSITIASGGTTTNSNSVSCATVVGATGYKLYKVALVSGRSYYVVYDLGSATTFTDTGGGTYSVGVAPTVNTTGTVVTEGSTAVAFSGENLASGMTAAIVQNGNTVAQTNVTYVSSTSGTFDLVMEPASGASLAATDAAYPTRIEVTVSGYTSAVGPIKIGPVSGVIFQTLLSVNPNAPMRIEGLPDLVTGDQVWAAGDSAGTSAAPSGLVISPSGEFYFQSGYTPQNFWARAYIAADASYTPWAKITVTGSQSGGFW